MRAQAELEYDGDYDDVCNNDSQSGIMYRDAYANVVDTSYTVTYCLDEDWRVMFNSDGTENNGSLGAGIDSNGNAWAAALPLSTGDWFCVDASGTAKEISGSNPLNHNGPDKTC